MREIFDLLFHVCALLIAVELVSHLFPEKEGRLIHGLAALSVLVTLVTGLKSAELPEIEMQDGDFSAHALQTEEYMAEAGVKLLTERLQGLLETAGIELAPGSDNIQVRYETKKDQLVVRSVSVRVRYATDISRAEALLCGVLTEAIPTEVTSIA